jgi:hypothetical protein
MIAQRRIQIVSAISFFKGLRNALPNKLLLVVTIARALKEKIASRFSRDVVRLAVGETNLKPCDNALSKGGSRFAARMLIFLKGILSRSHMASAAI